MRYKITIILTILNFAFLFSQEKTITLESVLIKGRKKNVKERHEFKRHALQSNLQIELEEKFKRPEYNLYIERLTNPEAEIISL